MSTTSSFTAEEEIKRRIMDRLESERRKMERINGEERPSEYVEAKIKKEKKVPLCAISVDKEDKISFEDIIGKPYSDTTEQWYDKNMQKSDEDWPEIMRKWIPKRENYAGYVFQHGPTNTMLRGMEGDKSAYIHGDTGTGKDTGYAALCSILRWPLVRQDGVEGLEAPDLVSYDIPNGDGYNCVETPLSLCAKHGGMYILSEPNVLPPSTRYALQSPLEHPRVLRRVGAMNPEDTIRICHPNFRIAVTSNTLGNGDDTDRFSGASEMIDHSGINRFELFDEVGYLNQNQEIEALLKYKKELGERLAKKMVMLGNLIRKSREQGGDYPMTWPWSLRQLRAWADSIMLTGEPVTGFKQVYYNALTNEQKTLAERFWSDVDFEEYKL